MVNIKYIIDICHNIYRKLSLWKKNWEKKWSKIDKFLIGLDTELEILSDTTLKKEIGEEPN